MAQTLAHDPSQSDAQAWSALSAHPLRPCGMFQSISPKQRDKVLLYCVKKQDPMSASPRFEVLCDITRLCRAHTKTVAMSIKSNNNKINMK